MPAYAAPASGCWWSAAQEVNWTYLSPAALVEPGPRTGTYRTGTDNLITDQTGRSRITPADLAVALLDEAEHPRHEGIRFTVAY